MTVSGAHPFFKHYNGRDFTLANVTVGIRFRDDHDIDAVFVSEADQRTQPSFTRVKMILHQLRLAIDAFDAGQMQNSEGSL